MGGCRWGEGEASRCALGVSIVLMYMNALAIRAFQPAACAGTNWHQRAAARHERHGTPRQARSAAQPRCPPWPLMPPPPPRAAGRRTCAPARARPQESPIKPSDLAARAQGAQGVDIEGMRAEDLDYNYDKAGLAALRQRMFYAIAEYKGGRASTLPRQVPRPWDPSRHSVVVVVVVVVRRRLGQR